MGNRWGRALAAAALAVGLASLTSCGLFGGHHTTSSGQGHRRKIPPPGQVGLSGQGVTMAIAPSSGPPGTRVTLTGHGFNGSVVVCFGRQAATDVVHVTASGTRLTAIVPPGGGLVAVLAITPDKTSIAAFEYTSSSTPAATMSSSADC